MNHRLFIIGTSAVLMVWLTATFLQDTPSGQYPRLGRGSNPLAAKGEGKNPDKNADSALDLTDQADAPVVVSK